MGYQPTTVISGPVDASGNVAVTDKAAESALLAIEAAVIENDQLVNIDSVGGAPIAVSADGTAVVTVAGPDGVPIDTIGNSMSVAVNNKSAVVGLGTPQAADVVVGARLEVPWNTQGSPAAIVAVTDVSNYRYVSIQINNVGISSTATPQISNDGLTWYGLELVTTTLGVQSGGSNQTIAASWTAIGMYQGPIAARFFRLNISAITGSNYGVAQFFAVPPPTGVSAFAANFPGAAAPADSTNSINAPAVVTEPLVFNGTTWDRVRSAGSTIATGTGVPASGMVGQVSPTGNPISPSLPANQNAQFAPVQMDVQGRLKVVTTPGPGFTIQATNVEMIDGQQVVQTAPGVQLVSIANAVGDPLDSISGALSVSVQPGSSVGLTPATTGGLLTASGSITNTLTAIKGAAGQVYGWQFFNSNAATCYVQFFNAPPSAVVLGTTVPFMSLGIPQASQLSVLESMGIQFAVGITIAITTTRAGATANSSTVDYNIFYN